MKQMKKVIRDIFFFAMLIVAMLVLCGATGGDASCNAPGVFDIEGEGCSVMDISTNHASEYEVSIPDGKPAALAVSGVANNLENPPDFFVDSQQLPDGVVCSEVTTENPSETGCEYSFDVKLPASLKHGDTFDLVLMNEGEDSVSEVARAIIRIVRIGDQPRTGDTSSLMLWMILLGAAGVLLLRRRAYN